MDSEFAVNRLKRGPGDRINRRRYPTSEDGRIAQAETWNDDTNGTPAVRVGAKWNVKELHGIAAEATSPQ